MTDEKPDRRDISQRRLALEAALLAAVRSPSEEMKDQDWENLRREGMREIHNLRKLADKSNNCQISGLHAHEAEGDHPIR